MSWTYMNFTRSSKCGKRAISLWQRIGQSSVKGEQQSFVGLEHNVILSSLCGRNPPSPALTVLNSMQCDTTVALNCTR